MTDAPKRTSHTSSTTSKPVPLTTSASSAGLSFFVILYQSAGIFFGIVLCFLGFIRSYQFLDAIWFQWLGDVKAEVIEQKASAASDRIQYHYTVFRIPAQHTRPSFKIRIDDKRLYEYIQRSVSPSSDRRVDAELVQRMLSRQPHLVRVGPIRLGSAPKSAELIIYIGLIVLGFMVAFTATRDLYKRWLRRGAES